VETGKQQTTQKNCCNRRKLRKYSLRHCVLSKDGSRFATWLKALTRGNISKKEKKILQTLTDLENGTKPSQSQSQ